MMKKSLCLFIALIVIVGFLPVESNAASGDEFVIQTFTGSDRKDLTKYNGAGGRVVIPDGVTFIGAAFKNCNTVTSVIIPESVTIIGIDAFRGCSSLVSVTISGKVTQIKSNAFRDCFSLTSVTIPNSVTSVENEAFRGCGSLTSVIIPDNVTAIGNYAFSECASLKKLTFGKGVAKLGNGIFMKCGSLESVVISDGAVSVGTDMFKECVSLTSVTIPGSVKSIGGSAFKDCALLSSVTIQNGVETISKEAFLKCESLVSLAIPDSVTTIGESAFAYCSSLKNITLGKNVSKLGKSVFNRCELLKSIVIPDKVAAIEDNAFSYCTSLAEVIIGNGVVSIGNRSFGDCPSLKNITLGKNIENISEKAFSNNSSASWSNISRTIHGEKNSFAQKYAEENFYKFVELGVQTSKTSFPMPSAKVSLAKNPAFTETKAAESVYDMSPDYYSNWAVVPYLQTIVNENGNISVLHIPLDSKSKITVYEYSPKMEFIKSVSFAREFERVGGYTKDKDGNYYIFYAKNAEDTREGRNQQNMLLAKYSPDGKKIKQCGVGANIDGDPAGVMTPFQAGNCRLEISGDIIAVCFARQMFNGHQSSLTLVFDIDKMEEIQTIGKGRSMSIPTVSHSFNQFILPTDEGFAFVNHGDANPRGFDFSSVEKNILGYNRITAFEFYNPDPEINKTPALYNQTYAEMGGLAETDDGYIFAGTYDKNKPGDGVRNLFLLVMNKDLESISKPLWFSAYKDFDAISPKIVRIAQDEYLLMWRANKKTYAAIVNGKGKTTVSAKELPGVTLNSDDVLRYNPVTGLVHWAVAKDDKTIALYGFSPDYLK